MPSELSRRVRACGRELPTPGPAAGDDAAIERLEPLVDTFRVRCRDSLKGREHVVYLEAADAAAAAAHLAPRGLVPLHVDQIDPSQRPADQTLVRVRSAAQPAAPMPPIARRMLLVLVGLGLALLIILGTLFVSRAKEHLGLPDHLRERRTPPAAAPDAVPSPALQSTTP